MMSIDALEQLPARRAALFGRALNRHRAPRVFSTLLDHVTIPH
jgi:hypothetical protein